ncbi:MAG: efflux RND transporter periplasmic adaptor subunit [Candidatus Obscuribacterales bacterium]|nr:efflux RND transporter periplasmic adaptor subunit [Candidatus Obscuribacterales bacterium]
MQGVSKRMHGSAVRLKYSNLIASLLCASLLASCSQKEEKSESNADQKEAPNSVTVSKELSDDLKIKTEAVEKRMLATSLHVTGQIHPEFGKEISLTTRVAGRVVDILVTPGQHVKAGQVLALIDSQNVSELQAELIEAKSKLQIARAHQDREEDIYDEQLKRPKALIAAREHSTEAKVQLELTEREFKRVEQLHKEGIAAAKDYFSAQANYAKAQAAFRQASSDLQREEQLFQNKAMMKRDFQLAQAETKREEQHLNTLKQRLRFLGMTEKMLEQVLSSGKIEGTVPILAPIDGLITHQDIAMGEIVDPGKQALRISDLSTVSVTADISEVDLTHVTIGTKVRVHVTGFPGKFFDGTVSYISSHVNPDSRTVPIRSRLSNPDLKLKANMFAETDIELSPRMVLACPKSAVLERDAHKIVYLSNAGTYKEQRIITGSSNEKYYEVISGLAPGDKVVTSGTLLLKTELGT